MSSLLPFVLPDKPCSTEVGASVMGIIAHSAYTLTTKTTETAKPRAKAEAPLSI